MNTLRVIQKPHNGQIRISLPDSFDTDLVEVTIVPIHEQKSQSLSRLEIAQQYLAQKKKSSFDTGSLDPHEQ